MTVAYNAIKYYRNHEVPKIWVENKGIYNVQLLIRGFTGLRHNSEIALYSKMRTAIRKRKCFDALRHYSQASVKLDAWL